MGIQIASAWENAAEVGVVHRDLKPKNAMITWKKNVKVLDFGLARLFRSDDENITESTDNAEGVVGTLPYMAPEQLRGEPTDFRSDIYSLGAILYESSTGERPFDSRISTGLICGILNKSPIPLRQRNSNLSSGFESIVLRCLAKDPRQRYQWASRLRVALETIRGSDRGVPPPQKQTATLRSLRVFAVAALLLVMVGFFNLKFDAAMSSKELAAPVGATHVH